MGAGRRISCPTTSFDSAEWGPQHCPARLHKQGRQEDSWRQQESWEAYEWLLGAEPLNTLSSLVCKMNPILETRKLRQYSLPQIIQPRMGPTSTGPQSLNGASVTSHDLSLSEWRPHDFLSICDKKPGQQGRDVPDGHVRTIHVVRSQKPAGGSPRPVWVTLN